jgi:hypothetical protein
MFHLESLTSPGLRFWGVRIHILGLQGWQAYACNRDLIGTVTSRMVGIQTLEATCQPCDVIGAASIDYSLHLAPDHVDWYFY